MLATYPELTEGFDYYLASFEAAIPIIVPSGKKLGDVDCDKWNARDDFVLLSSSDNLCTREVYLDAMIKDN